VNREAMLGTVREDEKKARSETTDFFAISARNGAMDRG
jgi:hypothetical protein